MELWVVPNPSELNAHQNVAILDAAYRKPAQTAGLLHDGHNGEGMTAKSTASAITNIPFQSGWRVGGGP